MATTLTYTVSDFVPFTKILSADVNSRFNDIKNRLNADGTTATGLGDDNIQSNTVSGGGLTRSTKLKAGTANYVIINGSDGKMSEEATLASTRGGLGFAPTISSSTAGKVVGVNDGGTALELRSPSAESLIEGLHNTIAGITAGEVITANDAVALILNEGTYKVVQARSDVSSRNSGFLGFALNSATVTPQIVTLTKAASWTTGTESVTVNNRTYSQAFTSSNDDSMTALAALIAADPDVASAAVTGGSPFNVITITGEGALTITVTAVESGGAPTLTPATTQSPVGSNVRIQAFGPMTGFSGLTQAASYYTSSSPGDITTVPANSTTSFVGQALSSTVLMVSPNRFNFSLPGNFGIMVRSHGSSTGGTGTANATQNSEHFNFNSWSTGTSDTTVKYSICGSEAQYNSMLHVVDGIDSDGSTVTAYSRTYNKATWSSFSTRSIAKQAYGIGVLNNTLYLSKGSTGNSHTTPTNLIDAWNGSTWTNGTGTLVSSRTGSSTFIYGGLLRIVGGVDSASNEQNDHETWNGVTVGSDTVLPQNKQVAGSFTAPNSYGFTPWYTGSANKWNGSWSATISFGTQVLDGNGGRNTGPTCAFDQNNNLGYTNGGGSGGDNSISSTFSFNGTTLSASTASSTARAGASGGTV